MLGRPPLSPLCVSYKGIVFPKNLFTDLFTWDLQLKVILDRKTFLLEWFFDFRLSFWGNWHFSVSNCHFLFFSTEQKSLTGHAKKNLGQFSNSWIILNKTTLRDFSVLILFSFDLQLSISNSKILKISNFYMFGAKKKTKPKMNNQGVLFC